MNLQPLFEIKNYPVICHQLYDTFINEPDYFKISFGAIEGLFPGHTEHDSIEADNAIKFIIKQIRSYCNQFYQVDIADHLPLIEQLYNHIEYAITN